MKRLCIGFLLPHYSSKSRSFMPAVAQALAESGVMVDIIHPVDRMVDLSEVRVEHDLYVLRHTSSFSLSLAGGPYELCAIFRNPISVSRGAPGKDHAPPVLPGP